jgi:hypothetical protein
VVLDDDRGDATGRGVHHREDSLQVPDGMGDRQGTREVFILDVDDQ